MHHFKIQSQNIQGFAVENAEKGDIVKILAKHPLIISDDPNFVFLLTQISGAFLNKTNMSSDFIYKFLIVLHKDNTADIYINDFNEMMLAKINKPVDKGQVLYVKDISDISEIKFPDIDIKETDAIIYCIKIGWKFGLFFDFTREINLGSIFKELGNVRNSLVFEKIEFQIDNAIKNSKDIDALIFTEGKTDWKHLKKAKERLGYKKNITFHESDEDYGDSDLIKTCEHFARIKQNKKIIFIFDRDNHSIINILQQKTRDGEDFQDWGNNVYSFMIPVPSHRDNYSNISIEFFYTDTEIMTRDSNSRRLFFTNELKKEITPDSRCIKKQITADTNLESQKKIEDQDVQTIVDNDGKQIAMSKSVFANYVLNGISPFNTFDFKEFMGIFDIINNIIIDNKK